MESVRSPLSGDEDAIDISHTNGHRRHQSAGTFDMTQPDSTKKSTTVSKEQQQAAQLPLEPSRIVDGLVDQKPENLSEAERGKRVVEVIEQQFNLEIILKHRQLVEIEEEIGKCEAQMIALRNKYRIEPNLKLPNEPKEFTEKYLNILQKTEGLYNRHKSVTWNNNYLESPSQQSQYGNSNGETLYSRTRSQTSSLRPSSGRYSANDCIYRRTDGVYVKLTCPNCGRCNFSSAQGFLNHCRLAHQKEFTSQDNAAVICGEILHDEDQDPDGVKVILDLRSQGLDPNKNLARPEVLFISDLLLSAGETPTPLLESGSQQEQGEDLKKRGRPSATGASSFVGSFGSKTPRTTANLKLKLKNLGKGSEFDDLVKDVTSKVENPHLFADEEEVEATATETNLSFSRPSVSARGSTGAFRGGGSGRGRGRGRRKSRGGFSLLNENDDKMDLRFDDNSNNTVDDEPTLE